MKAAGIICEYNPFHIGHQMHINNTKRLLGEEYAIVCAMSGNFVQRGEPAIFNKHVRAEAAVRCGADLVLEIPTPYVLSSAEGYAVAGVNILTNLDICEYLSFGSEVGDVDVLCTVAEAIISDEIGAFIKENMRHGTTYAKAVQKTLDDKHGEKASVLKKPNNLLGIEYIKAIVTTGSHLKPMTFKRSGGVHDGSYGYSSSAVRQAMLNGDVNSSWEAMPSQSGSICKREIREMRGPLSLVSFEQAIMARLRQIDDYSQFPGAGEGLENRFAKYAAIEPTVSMVLERVKTKRYVMSKLRRMLLCACLGVTTNDTKMPPPYLRVLAINEKGIKLLGEMRGRTGVPIIVKPARAKVLTERTFELFNKEADATDFYVLAYKDEMQRVGGSEWRNGPVIAD